MNASIGVDTAATLREVLAASVPDLHRHCHDPWVLIGSGAAWLAGAKVTVADLDVLTSTRDAETLMGHWRGRLETTIPSAGAERFRSHFARFVFPGLAVEIMGGLDVLGDAGWEPVRVGEIIAVDVAGMRVPIPAIEEQIRVLESFGRPKDSQRAALLKALHEERPRSHTRAVCPLAPATAGSILWERLQPRSGRSSMKWQE